MHGQALWAGGRVIVVGRARVRVVKTGLAGCFEVRGIRVGEEGVGARVGCFRYFLYFPRRDLSDEHYDGDEASEAWIHIQYLPQNHGIEEANSHNEPTGWL